VQISTSIGAVQKGVWYGRWTLLRWRYPICSHELGDSSLLIGIRETAKEQLEHTLLDFVQEAAAQVVPQAVPVSLIVECDHVQVSWVNNLETELVQIQRREGDQSEGQSIASVEGSPTTYNDTTVQSATIYTYTVKDYGKVTPSL